MKARKIVADEAREFWAHPSQQLMDVTPDKLHDNGLEYWACGPICTVFHSMPWPGVWGAHYGAKPEGWGRLTDPALACLRAFWAAHEPQRIVGWTASENRAAIAFARRLGFTLDGVLPLDTGAVVMTGWRP